MRFSNIKVQSGDFISRTKVKSENFNSYKKVEYGDSLTNKVSEVSLVGVILILISFFMLVVL